MPKTFGLSGVYLYFPYLKLELNICLFSNTYFKITLVTHFTFVHWRRKWQPTPVFLPGKSQGRWSLVSCRLWGCTELDTTEATQQQQQQQQQQCVYVYPNIPIYPSPFYPLGTSTNLYNSISAFQINSLATLLIVEIPHVSHVI